MKYKVELPKLHNIKFDIQEYGAISGGKVSNTSCIQKAIEDASIEGGQVVIPKGIWLTGAIELKSNVNLHVVSGGVLLFHKIEEEYPLIPISYEGLDMIRCKPLIYAKNANNIAITGQGVIDGSGDLWRMVKKYKVTELMWKELLEISPYVYKDKEELWFPSKSSYQGFIAEKGMRNTIEDVKTAQQYFDYYRPVLVHICNCNQVLIQDITLENSPAWNVHLLYSQNITIEGATIRNPHYAQNGDGIDIESCQYVYVNRTTLDVGDDALCLKSGKGPKAREIKIPTEYVHIENCIVYHGHGGFVVGSEMSRGVREITVNDCTFVGTDIGLRFKSALGRGGVVENIHIVDITMQNIKQEAIILTMGYVLDYDDDSKNYSIEDIPFFRGITMERIQCNGAKIGLKIEGLTNTSDTITDIYLKNSIIYSQKPMELKNEGRIVIENVEWTF